MLATVESKNQAVSKLEALIERGRSRAANVIDHVMRNQPIDRLARGEALQFRAADTLPEILMTVPDREQGTIEQSLHRNAVYQMAQATDMPVKFIDSLQSVADPWGRQLLAHNLQTVFNRRFQKKHYLSAFLAAGSARISFRFLPPHRLASHRGGLCHGGAGEGSVALRGLCHRYQDRHPGDHAGGL